MSEGILEEVAEYKLTKACDLQLKRVRDVKWEKGMGVDMLQHSRRL